MDIRVHRSICLSVYLFRNTRLTYLSCYFLLHFKNSNSIAVPRGEGVGAWFTLGSYLYSRQTYIPCYLFFFFFKFACVVWYSSDSTFINTTLASFKFYNETQTRIMRRGNFTVFRTIKTEMMKNKPI